MEGPDWAFQGTYFKVVHVCTAGGLFGVMFVLWFDVIAALFVPTSRRSPRVTFGKPPQQTAFFSLRFGPEHGVQPMAKVLQAALAEHGIDGKIIDMEAGA
eukprot:COSAG02_NODE_739_length_17830_cov_14.978174_5_plen_100_part_00